VDIGIIGGADGPTAIYVSSGGFFYIALAVIVLLIAVVGFIVYKKRKE